MANMNKRFNSVRVINQKKKSEFYVCCDVLYYVFLEVIEIPLTPYVHIILVLLKTFFDNLFVDQVAPTQFCVIFYIILSFISHQQFYNIILLYAVEYRKHFPFIPLMNDDVSFLVVH